VVEEVRSLGAEDEKGLEGLGKRREPAERTLGAVFSMQ
jgi:hypothetical protein